jgi:hypothetical protein
MASSMILLVPSRSKPNAAMILSTVLSFDLPDAPIDDATCLNGCRSRPATRSIQRRTACDVIVTSRPNALPTVPILPLLA